MFQILHTYIKILFFIPTQLQLSVSYCRLLNLVTIITLCRSGRDTEKRGFSNSFEVLGPWPQFLSSLRYLFRSSKMSQLRKERTPGKSKGEEDVKMKDCPLGELCMLITIIIIITITTLSEEEVIYQKRGKVTKGPRQEIK